MSKERTYEKTHQNIFEETKKHLEDCEEKKVSLGHGITLDYLVDAKLHIEELYKFINRFCGAPPIVLTENEKILLEEAQKYKE